jgi:predicted RNase H-like HicB family nuclease/uncharacterized damage-inducible protein DinB
MPYIVCAEEMEDNWIAHVPDLPGCFSTHRERDVAINSVPQAVEAYLEWTRGHGLHITGLSGPMMVSEVVRSWNYDTDYEVNAFFASDRPPVSPDELPEFERLLQASRKDLLEVIQDLDVDDLTREFSGERWPISGILLHLANSEWWYLDRIGLASLPRDISEDPLERLTLVRRHLSERLPALADRTAVATLSGETWSARKVLRRAMWHERDHTQHIRKLRQQWRRG